MNFTLKIWRQKDAKTKGGFETYKVENISADTSFLEMLDILNNNLIHEGKEPVAFDHDCREGICGMCSLHIDGHAHGPGQAATTCQIYMRKFKDGATITIEPWRSAAFPVIKDLVVNRSAYDQILQAGGFISVRTNSVPDANAIPISQADAEAMIGEIKYRDYTGDGAITDADKRVIGDTNPDFTYGLTNTLRYKNFTLSFFFQGTYGNDIVNANTIANNTSSSMTGIQNITREQYNTRWTAENAANARWPKPIEAGYKREWKFSDRYIEDGSYLRLKNISLGYTFFPKWKGIKSINVYASAQNLFTVTGYSWYDPDVNAYGNDVTRQGVDLYSYPSRRVYSFGLKLTF
mgnify:CR=1 FL=1